MFPRQSSLITRSPDEGSKRSNTYVSSEGYGQFSTYRLPMVLIFFAGFSELCHLLPQPLSFQVSLLDQNFMFQNQV